MRTGSVGNRSAEEMVNTLPEKKKQTIESVRKQLLDRNFLEEVEFDYINIEPVLVYSKSEKQIVFLKHKWETIATIPIRTPNLLEASQMFLGEKISNFLITDDDSNQWLRFQLPENELLLIQVIEKFLSEQKWG